MGEKIKKVCAKNHKMGFWSLLCSFVPIIWIIITFINDLTSVTPVDANIISNTYFIMIIFLSFNAIGIIFGIKALYKKGYKKTLAIWGIIINLILPISSIISYIKK